MKKNFHKSIRPLLVGAIFFACLATFRVASAEELYVAQTAAGNDDGTSCANAKSASWFNTVGSWMTGDGLISAGDTVHLCGTITQRLETQGGGSIGNPVTILFETDAELSAPAWDHQGAIVIDNSFIIIDGGTNGLIESTANGEGLANQILATGVQLSHSSNVEIKNLTISNLYQKTAGSTDANNYGTGISLNYSYQDQDHTGISIHDCHIDDSYEGISLSISSENVGVSDVDIFNNTITRTNSSIDLWLSADADQTLDDIRIYNNTITDNYVWDGGDFIAYGIRVFDSGLEQQTPTNSVTDLAIFGNTIGSATGLAMGTQANGWIYLYGASINTPMVYNNLLLANDNSYPPLAAGAFVNIFQSDQARVFNNTFVSSSSHGHGVKQRYSTGSRIMNNIFSQVSIAIYLAFSSTIESSDYNDIYTSNGFPLYNNGQYDLTSWRSTFSFDTHSIASDPSLGVTFKPDNLADPVVNTGTDLSSYFLTDKDSIIRPFSTGWDMGAYEYYTAGLPTVTLGVTDNQAAEPGADTGTFTLTRSNTSGNLTVNYVLSGTATNGTDYQNRTGSVVISDGSATSTVTIVPLDDSDGEGLENVILTLSPSSSYAIQTSHTGTVNLIDNEADQTGPSGPVGLRVL